MTTQTVFILDTRDGAARVAIYDQWSGTLTLYRDGLVAVQDHMYDDAYYAATRSYIGAPVGQIAERVARWGSIANRQPIDTASLSAAEYGQLMRGVIPVPREADVPAPVEDQPAAEDREDRPIVWKREVRRHLRHARRGRRLVGIVWHHPDGRMAKIKRRDFPRSS
jgi:hypothetical protein